MNNLGGGSEIQLREQAVFKRRGFQADGKEDLDFSSSRRQAFLLRISSRVLPFKFLHSMEVEFAGL